MAVYLQRALTVCVLVTQLNPSWKGIKLQVCKRDALRLRGSATQTKSLLLADEQITDITKHEGGQETSHFAKGCHSCERSNFCEHDACMEN